MAACVVLVVELHADVAHRNIETDSAAGYAQADLNGELEPPYSRPSAQALAELRSQILPSKKPLLHRLATPAASTWAEIRPPEKVLFS